MSYATKHSGNFSVGRAGWPEDWEKVTQILEKVAKTGAKPKSPNVSASKLNLKVQNIYNKPLLKPDGPCFETAYFGENVKKLLKKAVAQMVAITMGYFIFSKICNGQPRVA